MTLSDQSKGVEAECVMVTPFSDEWHQARALCYALFYEMHGLPWEVMDDGMDHNAFQVCVKTGDRVIASGRMTKLDNNRYDVTGMVVAPTLQHQGFGSIIMNRLIEIGKQQHAVGLTLKARTTAVHFYSKFGFVSQGDIFPSTITGVPHIRMTLKFE